jgi:hypothetical protein
MSGPTHHGFFKNPINASSFSNSEQFCPRTRPPKCPQYSSWPDDANDPPEATMSGRKLENGYGWKPVSMPRMATEATAAAALGDRSATA